MSTVGEILVTVGAAANLAGWLGIFLCAFRVSVGRGLVALLFPFLGFGVAMRRFPWLVWLWLGGIALVIVGAILT